MPRLAERNGAYGRRGGDGPTAGRKAEILVDPVSGASKRVFFGQRWLCIIQQHEQDRLSVSAWSTRDEAERHKEHVVKFLTQQRLDWLERRAKQGAVAGPEPYGAPLVEYVIEGTVQATPAKRRRPR